MDHQASAGWPTGVMAPEALEKGLYGMSYDPYSIAVMQSD